MQIPQRVEDTRLEKNRSGRYEVRWTERDGQGRARTRSHSCGTEDRQLAEEVRRALMGAAAQVATSAHRVRLGALVDKYVTHHVEINGLSDSQKWALKPIKAALGRLFVSDVTTSEAVGYRRGRAGTVKDATIRRELGALQAVLKWAVKAGELDRDTVLPHVPLPPASQPREIYLDREAEARLWAKAEGLVLRPGVPLGQKRIGVFVCLALETAARARAIEGLTWDRVHLTGGLIDFREPGRRVTKKKRVAIPISDRLRPVLVHWFALSGGAGQNIATGPVLLSTGSARKAWERFRAKHGFDGVTRHSLRHTWATLKLQRGVDIWQVAGVLGDTVEMVQRVYGHHCPENLRSAVNA